ncbi:MAG: type II toxin-antitoxin system RelE/ParE family toxin [Phycisphaerae bacterium]
MKYAVLLSSAAAKEFKRLPVNVIARLDPRILALSEEPRPPGGVKLRGKVPNGWRIRVGDYRILYRIDDGRQQVIVYRIAHRREVYG